MSSLKKSVSKSVKKDRHNKKQRSDEWDDAATPEKSIESSSSDSEPTRSPNRPSSLSFSGGIRPILDGFTNSPTSSPRRASFLFARRPSTSNLTPDAELVVQPTTKAGKFFIQIDTIQPKFPKYSKGTTVLLTLQVGSEVRETKEYSSQQLIEIKEQFIFPTVGDFTLRVEAFKLKDKKRDEFGKKIRESLGYQDVKIGTLRCPLKTLDYLLVTPKKQTDHRLTIQLACRLDDQDKITSEEPDFKGDLSYSRDGLSWNEYHCQLRGRKLHLLTGKKQEKTVTISQKSFVKPTSRDGEVFPRHCFEIQCEESDSPAIVFLQARSEEEMKGWMEKLKESANSVF